MGKANKLYKLAIKLSENVTTCEISKEELLKLVRKTGVEGWVVEGVTYYFVWDLTDKRFSGDTSPTTVGLDLEEIEKSKEFEGRIYIGSKKRYIYIKIDKGEYYLIPPRGVNLRKYCKES